MKDKGRGGNRGRDEVISEHSKSIALEAVGEGPCLGQKKINKQQHLLV